MKCVAKSATNEEVSLETLSDKELFLIYKDTKNKDIRNELIKRYIYIAEIISKKYANKGIDYEDIYQVATLGLIYAVERFDLDKGYEFSSFATPTIIGEIKKYFRDKGWIVRIPRRIQELSKKVNDAKAYLEQKNKSTPKVSDIAEHIGCTEEEVLEVLDSSYVYAMKSLDSSYESEKDDKEVKISDTIGYDDSGFELVENRDLLQKLLNKLDDFEKKIILQRFVEGRTQSEIAKEMGVSQMTISRMEKKILAKMKKEYFL
ncbi:RNA polymerase, sigma 37 subunit, RpsB/SigB [Alkalithermobacter thermoalcaliphilus JW-YL-7 = DSM 7308]|uniref:RNA polymerase, sigma 28 subunit, Sig B/F/G subfamily n=1 Tax=Alkalithermobacter thermoalcaliphilus JW-YL-7 = DSM 7308 TaxID=1121328 RepID=A0A150FT37_CLOPD|nr:RNA polymerase, sigma 28 subunit, Sig B/F/G subfamily [[Clostridium] paradoxum JW-YL-7 = DSM 7308]SHL08117.1 RNA polymerase, sigma 37 subunit, RpsB/SigB [[Clostridium] paradoxum JW-YL-7 = DSM 7308]